MAAVDNNTKILKHLMKKKRNNIQNGHFVPEEIIEKVEKMYEIHINSLKTKL